MREVVHNGTSPLIMDSDPVLLAVRPPNGELDTGKSSKDVAGSTWKDLERYIDELGGKIARREGPQRVQRNMSEDAEGPQRVQRNMSEDAEVSDISSSTSFTPRRGGGGDVEVHGRIIAAELRHLEMEARITEQLDKVRTLQQRLQNSEKQSEMASRGMGALAACLAVCLGELSQVQREMVLQQCSGLLNATNGVAEVIPTTETAVATASAPSVSTTGPPPLTAVTTTDAAAVATPPPNFSRGAAEALASANTRCDASRHAAVRNAHVRLVSPQHSLRRQRERLSYTPTDSSRRSPSRTAAAVSGSFPVERSRTAVAARSWEARTPSPKGTRGPVVRAAAFPVTPPETPAVVPAAPLGVTSAASSTSPFFTPPAGASTPSSLAATASGMRADRTVVVRTATSPVNSSYRYRAAVRCLAVGKQTHPPGRDWRSSQSAASPPAVPSAAGQCRR
eukprot:TRINITY_DN8197_c0_g1_i1.p1 TRINITY_DN8197_c0_g1~~TRINITY_DN8197_c0_g1_i1.p1  ORF type:complete len:451 (-),score=59.60 TRINITY_DN8197_c0_g1_i1:188-1540(-)